MMVVKNGVYFQIYFSKPCLKGQSYKETLFYVYAYCCHHMFGYWLKINVRGKKRSSLSTAENDRIMKYKAVKGKDHMDLPQNNALQFEKTWHPSTLKNKKKNSIKGCYTPLVKKYLFKYTFFNMHTVC